MTSLHLSPFKGSPLACVFKGIVTAQPAITYNAAIKYLFISTSDKYTTKYKK